MHCDTLIKARERHERDAQTFAMQSLARAERQRLASSHALAVRRVTAVLGSPCRGQRIRA